MGKAKAITLAEQSTGAPLSGSWIWSILEAGLGHHSSASSAACQGRRTPPNLLISASKEVVQSHTLASCFRRGVHEVAVMRGTISGSMPGRYFFHLIAEDRILSDPLGVEVGDFAELEAAALEAIREFRLEEPNREAELRGWRMAVTDSRGTIVVLLPIFGY